MIRFIEIGEQILEGASYFAWWDTVTDTFLEYGYDQTWETWAEFEESFDQMDNRHTKSKSLSRFKRLYPKDREVMR